MFEEWPGTPRYAGRGSALPTWRTERRVGDGVKVTRIASPITLRSPSSSKGTRTGRVIARWALILARFQICQTFERFLTQPPHLASFLSLPSVSTMTDNTQRPKGQGRGLSALNTAIDALNLAKEASSGTPANPVFGPVALLVTMIRVSSFLFSGETLQAHTQSGHDGQQTGLRRYWVVLR